MPSTMGWLTSMKRVTGRGSGLRRGQHRVELARDALLRLDHVHHGVDQREVRERLGEVTQVPPAARVDLLRVKLQWARVGQQLLAQLACAIELADLAQRRDEPERAD